MHKSRAYTYSAYTYVEIWVWNEKLSFSLEIVNKEALFGFSKPKTRNVFGAHWSHEAQMGTNLNLPIWDFI